MGLLLRAVEVAGPYRWRWLLVDERSGIALADHRVELASHRLQSGHAAGRHADDTAWHGKRCAARLYRKHCCRGRR
jgi:hypothetical protein